jgi:hypothetical protein
VITAAKFYLRRFEDGVVESLPGHEALNSLHREMPDAVIDIHVKQGVRLSELIEQDSYSYQVASIYVGAEDHQALLSKYQRCCDRMQFRFAAWRLFCRNAAEVRAA